MAKGIIKILAGIIIVVVVAVPLHIQFQQNCAGFIKQAADANSVELALSCLNVAIKYAENNGLTKGYTSVFYKTEDENIGFWYENMKTCQKELKEAIGKSQLEQTNVLMKVRESLTDNGKDGTELTIPDGIEAYPNNLLVGCIIWFGIILVLIGIVNINQD